MKTLKELREAFFESIGEELRNLAPDRRVAIWLNDGQSQLNYWREYSVHIQWEQGASTYEMPADYHDSARLVADVGTRLPEYVAWAGSIDFLDPGGAPRDGAATLYYRAHWPAITGDQPSILPLSGDVAITAYATFRFYKRLVSARADFRRYSAIAGGGAADVEDVQSLARDAFDDFRQARELLPMRPPVTFFAVEA